MTIDQTFVVIIISAGLFGLGIGVLWEGRGK
jgi:hypothetical protein